MPLISVSRRTDIPAYYGPWFMNRIAAGYCLVKNPFRPDQVRRVSLEPEQVEGLIFWTRRPGPFLRHLDALDPFPFYFQVTLNAMSTVLEPHLPPEDESCRQFVALASRLGRERVVWRFDPLLVTDLTPPAEILSRFSRLCHLLSAHTRRVVVSRAQLYTKVRRRLGRVAGLKVTDLQAEPGLSHDLLGSLAEIAARHGLSVYLCADKEDYSHLGLNPGRCIDPEILNGAYGLNLKPPRDRGQRKECGCAQSVDIGAYNSCLHGCVYCYANTSHTAACQGHARHDPRGEQLLRSTGS